MRALAAALALGLLCGASAARAELYKCQGPDGKTLFTSDRSQCPGASAHEPKGEIQRSEARPAPRTPPPAARPAPGFDDDEAEAQAWRAKRRDAEASLAEADAQLATLREMASFCNRGGEIWAEDRDGLRHSVDCEQVDASEAALSREQKRLRAYLDGGLEEECRRAGCLPGWLR
jgi:hypothetical protein